MNLFKPSGLIALSVGCAAAFASTNVVGTTQNGAIRAGIFDGLAITSYAVGPLQSDETLIAIGNLTGSEFDIVVRRGSRFWLWSYVGNQRVSRINVGVAPAAFTRTVGIADLDDDGNKEFLVANPTTGRVLGYEVNSSTGLYVERMDLGVLSASGFDLVVGVADVDRDGDEDIILQSSVTRQVRYRYMDGAIRGDVSDVVTDGAGEVVAPGGILSGASIESGVLTLVFKPLTGDLVRQWQMSGTTRTANLGVRGWSAGWNLVGLGS